MTTKPKDEVETDRQAWARAEMTRDPIFMYQTRSCRWNETDDGTPDGVSYGPWRTPESVWLSRAEAEDWGRNNEHNHPAGAWRVFCTCAEGALAKMLTEHAGRAK